MLIVENDYLIAEEVRGVVWVRGHRCPAATGVGIQPDLPL
jgi:hypothetical protein